MATRRTQTSAEAPYGLKSGGVGDDDVRVADSPRGGKGDWVWGEVRVGEQIRPVPRRRPLGSRRLA